MFPVGGSAEGRPSFALFADGPCKAASTAFSLNFEAQREAIGGVGAIRLVLTPPTPIFGPLIFYGVLLDDGNLPASPEILTTGRGSTRTPSR
jgi:hypothetical protein